MRIARGSRVVEAWCARFAASFDDHGGCVLAPPPNVRQCVGFDTAAVVQQVCLMSMVVVVCVESLDRDLPFHVRHPGRSQRGGGGGDNDDNSIHIVRLIQASVTIARHHKTISCLHAFKPTHSHDGY